MSGELTGKRRYVRRISGLVVQVEVAVFEKGQWTCIWRDAHEDDLPDTEVIKPIQAV